MHHWTLAIYSLISAECGLNTVSSLWQTKYITCAPLNSCELFTVFSPVRDSPELAASGKPSILLYIAVKFKDFYASPTDRLLFLGQATEQQSLRHSKYVWEVVKWDEEKEENYYSGAEIFHFTVQLMYVLLHLSGRSKISVEF